MTAAVGTALQTFAIDKAHSEATFQVRHLVTKVRGRFTDFAGTIQFDEARPEQGAVSFEVATASIDTGTADRDQHLRSEDFFFVEKHPTITFISSHVTRKTSHDFDVAGTLTIRGVAKNVTLPVTYLGAAKDPWGNARVGFETEIPINRKDFGLTWNTALETGGFLVGDEVKISVSVQAIAQ
jgi:polyisoprenoid-binding protein YceI